MGRFRPGMPYVDHPIEDESVCDLVISKLDTMFIIEPAADLTIYGFSPNQPLQMSSGW
jgi:hypothetical protein